MNSVIIIRLESDWWEASMGGRAGGGGVKKIEAYWNGKKQCLKPKKTHTVNLKSGNDFMCYLFIQNK